MGEAKTYVDMFGNPVAAGDMLVRYPKTEYEVPRIFWVEADIKLPLNMSPFDLADHCEVIYSDCQ